MNNRSLPICLIRPGTAAGLMLCAGMAVSAEDTAVFADAEPLTTARLVEQVLLRNPDIPAMEAAREAALARIEQAAALDDPMLSYAVAPRTAGAAGVDFGQRLALSQRVPWPGKRRLRAEAARLGAAAAAEDVERTRLRLIETARAAFADWYFVHAALRINDVNTALLNEFRNIAELQYAAGRTSRQDALQAEVEVAMLEHRDIVLGHQQMQILAALNTLLQRTPEAPLPEPAGLPGPVELPALAELRAAALEYQPALRALDARIAAARQQIDLAGRAFYPDFELMAEYNSMWMLDEHRFAVGIGINLPLTGKRRAAEDEAHAGLMQLRAERDARRADALDAVQQAYELVLESEHVLLLMDERLVPLAAGSLAAARSDYESGRGDFLNLISSEKTLMQTRLRREQALADYHRHVAALEHAVGGAHVLERITAQGGRP